MQHRKAISDTLLRRLKQMPQLRTGERKIQSRFALGKDQLAFDFLVIAMGFPVAIPALISLRLTLGSAATGKL